ncbi:hypothetical protein HFO58_34740 [Rhizobium leguminosarum]|uniref:glycine betaine ABC transporter substrate-binding protein n=1 Tax=Rhizobium leguminosarum TaxID=384 RepID=UPI001C943C05|nr:glycine betaine ABC transporter substrate-binding protein [Rhizobium leguminosarum]MBY5538233.1 hypothetical protein [Rhizobium leguminosarum]
MHGLDFTKRSLLIGGAGTLIAKFAQAQVRHSGSITLGQVSLSFYAVTGAIVHEILENLGHKVTLVEGPHEEIFPLLGAGKIDLMAAVWLPEGHAAYWEKYGRQAIEVVHLYENARFFWATPNYVPEDVVRSISDLTKPDVMARMVKTIQGIGQGAAITNLSQRALAEYKLDAAGYAFSTGTQSEWISSLTEAIDKRQWIVFPTWAPQYLNEGGKIRPLSDPRGVLGGENHASLAASGTRIEAIPERTLAVLRKVNIGLDGVTQMDGLVNAGRKSPREAAQQWMSSNQVKVESWFRI